MADASEPDVIVLGETILDMARGTLTRGGHIVLLRSKSFRVLCELARAPGRVVSKDELLNAAWPNIHVTEDSLTQAIRDIRRCLGVEGPRLLRTVARRGFILCPSKQLSSGSPTSLQPRIAVLPLRDQTGSPDCGPLLDGLAEEITNGLARFRNLIVLARHSAFTAATDPPRDLREIGSRLGADYLVDGSARQAQGVLVLRIALNEAPTGEVIWGDSFVIEGSTWLTLQDLIPRQIVARLSASLDAMAQRRSLRQPSSDLSAFEHLTRGRALLRSSQAGMYEHAQAHLLAAIAADPSMGQAHSFLGMAEVAMHHYGLAPQEVKERAKARGQLAVDLSPEDSACYSHLAWFRSYLREFEAAEQVATRAVELNPCDADALFTMALVVAMRGRAAECLEWIARAKVINPLWPEYYQSTEAGALYDLKRYEESIRALSRLSHISGRQEMRRAAAYAQLGHHEAARRHAAQAVALLPGTDFVAMTREGWMSEHERELDHMIEGIEIALRLLDEG